MNQQVDISSNNFYPSQSLKDLRLFYNVVYNEFLYDAFADQFDAKSYHENIDLYLKDLLITNGLSENLVSYLKIGINEQEESIDFIFVPFNQKTSVRFRNHFKVTKVDTNYEKIKVSSQDEFDACICSYLEDEEKNYEELFKNYNKVKNLILYIFDYAYIAKKRFTFKYSVLFLVVKVLSAINKMMLEKHFIIKVNKTEHVFNTAKSENLQN